MPIFALMLATITVLTNQVASAHPDHSQRSTLPDGVYAVLREGHSEKELMPFKDGESIVVNRHRYLKSDQTEPPSFEVVHSSPEVMLDLAAEPRSVKEAGGGIRVLIKLKPKAANALERLTADKAGGQIAIVLGNEVVTAHKIRDTIKGGNVQITSCAPGGAEYLIEQLRAYYKGK
jgi:preprotein translocase subunit SecD